MAGFNKMFIMLPIMFAARKIDGEDPKMIFLLRCSYFSVQAIIVMIVAYIYLKSQAAAGDKQHDRTVYVAPAASVRTHCILVSRPRLVYLIWCYFYLFFFVFFHTKIRIIQLLFMIINILTFQHFNISTLLQYSFTSHFTLTHHTSHSQTPTPRSSTRRSTTPHTWPPRQRACSPPRYLE
jgi:hypothetical protein